MPILKPSDGFVEACPSNMPKVTSFMLLDLFQRKEYQEPELRNVKMDKSTRPSYGDNAVGYVQLQNDTKKETVHVKASVTPEHKVNTKAYIVNVIIVKETISKAFCDGCAASADFCKHTVAFVTWLHRESEKKSVTEVESYWQKSKLAAIKTMRTEDMRLEKMVKQRVDNKDSSNKLEFFDEFMQRLSLNKSNLSLLKQHESVKFSYAVHHLLLAFLRSGEEKDPEKFLKYCKSVMTDKECDSLAKRTSYQAADSLWFEMRQSRITASKLHEASRCKTPDGSLVNQILGVQKFKGTPEMQNGKELEPLVLKAFQKKIQEKITTTGFTMKRQHPAFGASPDGITKTHVIEIKCPNTWDTFETYFKDSQSSNPEPAPKHMAQVGLQMFLCGKKEGYFVVAQPDFKASGLTKDAHVTLDTVKIMKTMDEALLFWKKCVFPSLIQNI